MVSICEVPNDVLDLTELQKRFPNSEAWHPTSVLWRESLREEWKGLDQKKQVTCEVCLYPLCGPCFCSVSYG